LVIAIPFIALLSERIMKDFARPMWLNWPVARSRIGCSEQFGCQKLLSVITPS